MWLPPADHFTLPSASGIIVQGGGLYVGIRVEETSSTAVAGVRLHDGNTANGNFVEMIELNASESVREHHPYPMVMFQRALYFELTDGAVAGTVWLILLTDEQMSELVHPKGEGATGTYGSPVGP